MRRGTSRHAIGRQLALIHRNPALPETRNGRVRKQRDKEHLMLDIVMLALGLGFFGVAVGYTYACERL